MEDKEKPVASDSLKPNDNQSRTKVSFVSKLAKSFFVTILILGAGVLYWACTLTKDSTDIQRIMIMVVWISYIAVLINGFRFLATLIKKTDDRDEWQSFVSDTLLTKLPFTYAMGQTEGNQIDEFIKSCVDKKYIELKELESNKGQFKKDLENLVFKTLPNSIKQELISSLAKDYAEYLKENAEE